MIKPDRKFVGYSDSKHYSDKSNLPRDPQNRTSSRLNVIIVDIDILLLNLLLLMCQGLCLVIYMHFYASHQITLIYR